MLTVTITNIQYDVDESRDRKKILKGLPKEIVVNLDLNYRTVMKELREDGCSQDLEDAVSDHIAEVTGYTHNGFASEVKQYRGNKRT